MREPYLETREPVWYVSELESQSRSDNIFLGHWQQWNGTALCTS